MRGRTRARRGVRGPLRALLLLTLVACGGREPAEGEADQIAVGAAAQLWQSIEARLRVALETNPYPLPGVKAFELTHYAPDGEEWSTLRRSRQVLLIGAPTDPWIEEARGADPPEVTLPALIERRDLWARDQHVTVLLLSPGDPLPALEEQLADLHALYERRYREWVVGRLFPGGPDRALANSLQVAGGFELLLPHGYRWHREEHVFLFSAPSADSVDLIRQITVTWHSPITDAMQPDALLSWREQLATAHYGGRQVANRSALRGRPTTHRGNLAYLLMGTWAGRNPSGARVSGPFLLRAVICPTQDRTYLLDAWLYTTEQEKQKYVVQLESIMNSFRCGPSSGRATRRVADGARPELHRHTDRARAGGLASAALAC